MFAGNLTAVKSDRREILKKKIYRPMGEADGSWRMIINHELKPVSYTHLDVYKRQLEGITTKLLLLYTGPYILQRQKQ